MSIFVPFLRFIQNYSFILQQLKFVLVKILKKEGKNQQESVQKKNKSKETNNALDVLTMMTPTNERIQLKWKPTTRATSAIATMVSNCQDDIIRHQLSQLTQFSLQIYTHTYITLLLLLLLLLFCIQN